MTTEAIPGENTVWRYLIRLDNKTGRVIVTKSDDAFNASVHYFPDSRISHALTPIGNMLQAKYVTAKTQSAAINELLTWLADHFILVGEPIPDEVPTLENASSAANAVNQAVIVSLAAIQAIQALFPSDSPSDINDGVRAAFKAIKNRSDMIISVESLVASYADARTR